MHLSLATRAIAALVAGLALRDCVLLATSVLLWTAHLQQSLATAGPDRTKIWLRCVTQGAVLVALGLALAIHTAAVFLVMWSDHNGQPWLAAVIVLLLAFAGGPAQPPAVHRTVLALALIAALAQIEIKAPLVTRRLGLAAQASGTPCVLLSSHQQWGLPGTLTRWRIEAKRSGPAPFDANAPGPASWQLTLERCRGEAAGKSFIVEFSHESLRVRLSAASSDRAAEAGESGEGRRAFTG